MCPPPPRLFGFSPVSHRSRPSVIHTFVLLRTKTSGPGTKYIVSNFGIIRMTRPRFLYYLLYIDDDHFRGHHPLFMRPKRVKRKKRLVTEGDQLTSVFGRYPEEGPVPRSVFFLLLTKSPNYPRWERVDHSYSKNPEGVL